MRGCVSAVQQLKNTPTLLFETRSIKDLVIRFLVFLLLSLIYFSVPSSATGQSAISLVRFTATGRTNNILIEWETATEFNNAGFFVWASDLEDGVYNPISDFIEAKGDGVTGAIYGFIDIEVEPGVVKYYKLEAVELNQNSEFFGPVSGVFNIATPSATSTPTRTATANLAVSSSPTATLTLTAQVQSGSPTATSAENVIPSATTAAPTSSSNQAAYPGQATATQTQTPEFNYLGTPYLPIPSPTPQPAYPDQAITPTALQGEMAPDGTTVTEPTHSPTPGSAQAEEGTKSPQEIARVSGKNGVELPPFTALVVVLLIWALLAGWFYISVRRLE